MKPKPNIGELWEIKDTVKVDVGNKRATYLISGHGLVVGIHRNHDDFGDFYKVLRVEKPRSFSYPTLGEDRMNQFLPGDLVIITLGDQLGFVIEVVRSGGVLNSNRIKLVVPEGITWRWAHECERI